MNPLRSIAPRLTVTLSLAIVACASLLAHPAAASAQRVQDAPATASSATHESVPAGAAVAPASGTAAKPDPKAPKFTKAQLEQYIKGLQAQQAIAAAQTPAAPKTPFAAKFPWATHLFAAIFLVSAVGLVLLLAFQTTKQEGLSGTIGGRVEAAYRPRLGFDQQLQRVTSIAAITMVIFATVVSLTGI